MTEKWLYPFYFFCHGQDRITSSEAENNSCSFAGDDETTFHAAMGNTSSGEDNLDNLLSDPEVTLTHCFRSVQHDHDVCGNYNQERKIVLLVE